MDELQREALSIFENLHTKRMSRKAAFKALRNLGVSDPRYFLNGISMIIEMRETLGECEHSPARLRASTALSDLSLRHFDECLGHSSAAVMTKYRMIEMAARIDELKKG